MSTVGYCLGWRDTHPSRARHLPTVLSRLVEHLPDASIHLADSGHEVFNRSASMNLAARQATDAACDILILAGADLLLDGDLPAVVDECAADGRNHIAYTHYVGLTQPGTERFYRTGDWRGCEVAYDTTGACGGFVALPTANYWKLDGHDESFRGWGYEDVDFAIRAQLVRHDGTCVGLWHADDVAKPEHAAANSTVFHQKHPASSDTQQII